MRPAIISSFAGLILVACASNPTGDQSPESSSNPNAAAAAIERTESGFGDAALSPLEDVNLKRDKIPEALNEIKNPYLVETDINCQEIAVEVTKLDSLLGRDWDIPPPDKKGLSERAADGASTAFLDAVSSGASGLIPYRGVVRTLTGANSHAQKVRKAYERGSHRRTFLKAMGYAKGCEYPAAPLPPTVEDSKIVFR
ncbi:MAG: hypothetical protein AAFY82_04140 [Pseudomonadota bacterium]